MIKWAGARTRNQEDRVEEASQNRNQTADGGDVAVKKENKDVCGEINHRKSPLTEEKCHSLSSRTNWKGPHILMRFQSQKSSEDRGEKP